MPAAISTDTTPASRLARAPKITRESTSRPFSSVPIQCADRRRLADCGPTCGDWVEWRDLVGEHRDTDEQHDDGETGDSDRARQEAAQGELRRTLRQNDKRSRGYGGAHLLKPQAWATAGLMCLDVILIA